MGFPHMTAFYGKSRASSDAPSTIRVLSNCAGTAAVSKKATSQTRLWTDVKYAMPPWQDVLWNDVRQEMTSTI